MEVLAGDACRRRDGVGTADAPRVVMKSRCSHLRWLELDEELRKRNDCLIADGPARNRRVQRRVGLANAGRFNVVGVIYEARHGLPLSTASSAVIDLQGRRG